MTDAQLLTSRSPTCWPTPARRNTEHRPRPLRQRSRPMRRWPAAAGLLPVPGRLLQGQGRRPAGQAGAVQATLRSSRSGAPGRREEEAALRLGLGLGVEGDRVYAAGRKGDVVAFDWPTAIDLARAHQDAARRAAPASAPSWWSSARATARCWRCMPQDGATAGGCTSTARCWRRLRFREHLIVVADRRRQAARARAHGRPRAVGRRSSRCRASRCAALRAR